MVPHTELQKAINCYMIDIHSKTSKQKCNTIVTIDIYIKCRIRIDIYYIIKQIMSRNKTSYLTPFLQIYKKMKAIITKKLYPKLRIVNGNIDYVENTSFIDIKWIKKIL